MGTLSTIRNILFSISSIFILTQISHTNSIPVLMDSLGEKMPMSMDHPMVMAKEMDQMEMAMTKAMDKMSKPVLVMDNQLGMPKRMDNKMPKPPMMTMDQDMGMSNPMMDHQMPMSKVMKPNVKPMMVAMDQNMGMANTMDHPMMVMPKAMKPDVMPMPAPMGQNMQMELSMDHMPMMPQGMQQKFIGGSGLNFSNADLNFLSWAQILNLG